MAQNIAYEKEDRGSLKRPQIALPKIYTFFLIFFLPGRRCARTLPGERHPIGKAASGETTEERKSVDNPLKMERRRLFPVVKSVPSPM